MIHLVSTLLLPLAALACWRWSRLVSGALLLALVAGVVYGVWPWEPLRWVSAVTGTMGIAELGRRSVRRSVWRPPHFAVFDEEQQRHFARWGYGRPDVLAILLVWSAITDALSLLWWRRTEQWGALPVLQVIALLTMIVVSLLPRRNRA